MHDPVSDSSPRLRNPGNLTGADNASITPSGFLRSWMPNRKCTRFPGSCSNVSTASPASSAVSLYSALQINKFRNGSCKHQQSCLCKSSSEAGQPKIRRTGKGTDCLGALHMKPETDNPYAIYTRRSDASTFSTALVWGPFWIRQGPGGQ